MLAIKVDTLSGFQTFTYLKMIFVSTMARRNPIAQEIMAATISINISGEVNWEMNILSAFIWWVFYLIIPIFLKSFISFFAC